VAVHHDQQLAIHAMSEVAGAATADRTIGRVGRPRTALAEDVASSLPRLQRPTREHAIDYARTLFLKEERVDMHILSEALGIGRTTLYRWVGDREQLIGELLAELVDRGWDYAIEHAQGEGRERAMHAGRLFMEITANFAPVRHFTEREPQLALRVLLASDGLVAERIRAGFLRAFAVHDPDAANINPELVDIAVQAGTALEWAPIAIGGEPAIERASRLVRSLFQTSG
jgi:AcrR family transcriptional regulator